MTETRWPLIVIGGGAAGFMGAITCAEASPLRLRSGQAGRRVLLLERSAQLLAKVRISGGGRCNVTTALTDPVQLVLHYPRGGRELRGPFTRFGPKETVAWFAQHGVRLKAEADGRMFPITDDSQTIVDCLLDSARAAGVEIRTQIKIESIEKRNGELEIGLKDGERLLAERVLLATGSGPQGYEWATRLGHTIIPPVPSLFTFQLAAQHLPNLAGISVPDVIARLPEAKLEQRGPLLITHWGVSGPAILKLSAWGARFLHERAYHADLRLNWLPAFSASALGAELATVKTSEARRVVVSQSPFPLPLRLWGRLAARAGLAENARWADVSKAQLAALKEELHNGAYRIEGKGAFKDEFVTCGGVSLKEVNFKTMESRVCPGLYLAGEILDIDGVTGGFNFQSAWTTGWLSQRVGERMNG